MPWQTYVSIPSAEAGGVRPPSSPSRPPWRRRPRFQSPPPKRGACDLGRGSSKALGRPRDLVSIPSAEAGGVRRKAEATVAKTLQVSIPSAEAGGVRQVGMNPIVKYAPSVVSIPSAEAGGVRRSTRWTASSSSRKTPSFNPLRRSGGRATWCFHVLYGSLRVQVSIPSAEAGGVRPQRPRVPAQCLDR